MKTNHQRSFVESRKSRSNTVLGMMVGNNMHKKFTEIGEPKAVAANSPGWDHANGHRGTARAKAGAKKFLRTRLRFSENQALKKIVNTED